jgi:hypothetical protein
MLGVIHYNPHLAHQRDHARAFEQCGFTATTSKTTEADVHVVSGPYYALRQWARHPSLLMIDRAWWGDPDCVSIGWLNKDGTRTFATGDEPRAHPKPLPWKKRENTAIVLADYGQKTTQIMREAAQRYAYIRERRHPAEVRDQASLTSGLCLSDVAIGTSGTALFEAVMLGLPSVCLDPDNPVAEVCSASIDAPLRRPDRSEWLHKLSYAQFSLDEIADGTAWRLLRDVRQL